MGILNEVVDNLNLELSNNYKYYNFGGKVVYIENFVRILTFNKEEIILKLKKGMFKVLGINLIIEELNKNSLLIKGEIKGVEVY